MTMIDNQMGWRQFGAAIDMLGDCLRNCPDELWEKRLWEDEPDRWAAAGFSAFWHLGHHTLFWLDPYSTGAKEGLLGLRHPICFTRVSIRSKFLPCINLRSRTKELTRTL